MPIIFLGILFVAFTGGAGSLAPLLFFALPILIPAVLLALFVFGGTES